MGLIKTAGFLLLLVVLAMAPTPFHLTAQDASGAEGAAEADSGAPADGAAESETAEEAEPQLPRVLVLPLINETGQAQNDAVAGTTTDTIRLTINLLGQYQLVDAPELSSVLSEEQQALPPVERAALLADELAVESVLFGQVTREQDGTFVFTLNVYDRQDQAVTSTTNTESQSLFGVFDAADQLVAEAVGGFSGVRIGFGSARFTPLEDLTYRVYLDNSLAGENITTIERVLIGERTIRVTQVIDDRERVIYRETLEISEGETVAIEIAVPEATEAEIARANLLVDRIRQGLDQGTGLRDVESDLDELSELVAVAPGAAGVGVRAPEHLQERWELSSYLLRMADTDFGAVESQAAARDLIREFIDPLTDQLEDLLARPGTDEVTEELLSDGYRSAASLYNLLVLRRVGVEQDNAELISRLNIMLSFANNRLVRRANMSAPYGEETVDSRRFYRRYSRAVRRRRPFWHWVAGTIGAAGFAGGAYLQLVELPDQRQLVEDEQARYDAATSVADASDARSAAEEANQTLVFQEVLSYAGLASGVLVPISLWSRVRSLTRPRRLWRDRQEEPFTAALQAAAIDYRERAWESGEPAVLVVGEGEQVTLAAGGESLPTPVYVPFDGSQRLELTHDTAMLGAERDYEIFRTPGLTILYLGEPEIRSD